MLMMDVVFFECIADSGFTRGYGQKSYFFTLANYIFWEVMYMVESHTS